MSLTNPENVYQVGGSLPIHASTYVERSADRNLYEGLLAGNFCYVLNSRQMGKSSLRVQTMKKLQASDIICTAIDLTSIGSQDITPEQWYAGIVYSLASGLELLDKFNLGEWWQDRQFLSPLQRLGQFLSEIVLQEIQGKIVIFIDEIDSVLSLSFNVDDFFGLIRSCYQKDSNYERLAFALFGVASPADLIRNKNTNNNFSTPFNIGQAIDLEGFQLSEAMPLATGFRNVFEQPEEILKDILDWTGGQPFLTQKVCKLVSKYGQAYSENIVSNVVQQKIINNWEGQDEPEHLKTIRDRLLYSSKNKHELLKLYHQILQVGGIYDQNLSEYTELRLTGLVVKQNTKLKVYNRIYAEVFNLEWLTDEFKSSGWIIPSDLGENVNDIYFKGLDSYSKRDYYSAISNFEKLIKINPLDIMAYNYRGRSYFKLGKYQEAINDYNQAIAIKPDFALIYRNRGDVHSSLNNYEVAIADYNRAIAIDPKDNIAHMGRVIAQKKLNQSLTVTSDIKENQDLVYKTFEFETVTVNKKGEIIKRENKQAKYFTETLSNNITLDMVEIPGGSFIMGSPETETGRYSNEGPQHEVTIQTFYMGKYPITQAQYEAIMGKNPSTFKGEHRPVEKVTWQQAKEFCAILSKLTDKKYVLPSEAQWEYAARAGTTTVFHYGETITKNLAQYDCLKTDVAGNFPPNAFGLYDMPGNVWEWCEDSWHNSYVGAPNDGSAWVLPDNDKKVIRGGSWVDDSFACRVANRDCSYYSSIMNEFGFRVCCLIENTD